MIDFRDAINLLDENTKLRAELLELQKKLDEQVVQVSMGYLKL